MSILKRRHGHTDWCAGLHRCNLGEHRSDPLTVRMPGRGALILTRVRGDDGQEWAEVRGRVRLPVTEHDARQRLGRLLDDIIAAMGAPR